MKLFDANPRTLFDWVTDSAQAAAVSVALKFESQHLLDTASQLADIGGGVGSIFKLAVKMIPEPTAEQRIASQLHQGFVRALDKELARKPGLVSERAWRQYARGNIRHAADKRLGKEFTWLSLFGRRSARAGYHWPIIGELADLGRIWLAEAATAEIGSLGPNSSSNLQRDADEARGRIYDELWETMSKLLGDSDIQEAIESARSQLEHEGLKLLAGELTSLRAYRLFGEISQHALYIPPEIKLFERSTSPGQPSRLSKPGDQELLKIVRNGHPKLIVIKGEMGIGKSCLMRSLAAGLAEQYLRDRKIAPIYVRWRDIYAEPDLLTGIETQLLDEFGLSIENLRTREGVVYLIDGFDEMSSHQESHLAAAFGSLARLQKRGCSVIVSMRSAVVTPGVDLVLRDREALSVEVQAFDNEAIDLWAKKWTIEKGAKDVTGDRLRALCRYSGRQNSHSVAQNPLLLYMLAKYIGPMHQERKALSRTEIFRTFVDETIRGKIRSTREEFPIPFSEVSEHKYRLLLQEIAFQASWPRSSLKCSAHSIQKLFQNPRIAQELPFEGFRTAFVLHFFQPTDSSADEFEFQPEGFRQYLLAEWCVRAQIEALRDDSDFAHALARPRAEAMNRLAQFPIREEERYLLNEIYEELGGLVEKEGSLLRTRLTAFGLELERASDAEKTIELLYRRVQEHAESPPAEGWRDEKTGIPEGQEVPPGLDNGRLLLNYWDQCMIALLGLYRGLRQDAKSEPTFPKQDPHALSRFLRFWQAVRGFSWSMDLNLSRAMAPGSELQNCTLQDLDMHEADLRSSNFQRALLRGCNLSQAHLEKANLENTDASGADLSNAKMQGANLRAAILTNADLTEAKAAGADLEEADLNDCSMKLAILSNASLRRASLKRVNLEKAVLRETFLDDANLEGSMARGAKFIEAQLYRVNLKGANLSRADMHSAVLEGAALNNANLRESDLVGAILKGADLTEAKLSLADLRNADFRGANLSKADLSGAQTQGADFTGANMVGVIGFKSRQHP